jgi:hypothetical protein
MVAFPTIGLTGGRVVESSSFSPVVEFTVSLSAAAATEVRADYRTFGGTATEGSDFFDRAVWPASRPLFRALLPTSGACMPAVASVSARPLIV